MGWGGRGFRRQSREYGRVRKFLKMVTDLLQGRKIHCFVGVCMHFSVHKLYSGWGNEGVKFKEVSNSTNTFFFFLILYVNCFGRTMLNMCIEYHI